MVFMNWPSGFVFDVDKVIMSTNIDTTPRLSAMTLRPSQCPVGHPQVACLRCNVSLFREQDIILMTTVSRRMDLKCCKRIESLSYV